jgi:hypothetical protein
MKKIIVCWTAVRSTERVSYYIVTYSIGIGSEKGRRNVISGSDVKLKKKKKKIVYTL